MRRILRCKTPLLIGSFVALCAVAGCSDKPDRQDPLDVSASTHGTFLPEAESIHERYKPAGPDEPPNPVSAYHVPPVMSYEDRPLSDNIASAIELADYAVVTQRAGYWQYLEGEDNYTVLAIPNKPFEAYYRVQVAPLAEGPRHTYVRELIGQTIIKGSWDVKKIRRRAARSQDGTVRVKTLSGPDYDLLFKPLPDGRIQVIGRNGSAMLKGSEYKQANGMLLVIDSVLPHR
ncbi:MULTISPECIES: hypothetical protein [Bombella]|uniref:FAS1 domain-containing protein n=1 Tax=Bombella pollinis TaxID=2967337 RepID=A0ABT3WR25_9PROT|nr:MULTISPECIES: hypothetical protein [Bombella]MCT6837799.1 hypothetical protein [Bifidobacteriales bacterium]MCX5620294.1 hypothetical protein [Bombella pollinis]MUG04942.1 hypothetical protein [Bombella sp. ESL0378]MUG90491.1 hypothetical protein [Bombella sp. ESL0385]